MRLENHLLGFNQSLSLEKTEGPDHSSGPLEFSNYSEDPRICPVLYMRQYLKQTRSLRSSEKLFVSLKAPHGAVTTSTIARWLQKVITMSGQSGTGGSTRSASSSKAVMEGASLSAVLSAGDWARASTFRRFYYKPSGLSFQSAVLN